MIRRQTATRVRPQLEDIEPRILYSADAGALFNPDAILPSAEVRVLNTAIPAVPAANQAQTTTRNEIVFVSTDVANYQTLVDDITKNAGPNRNIQVVLLDSNANGIEQISQTLKTEHNIDAIHIISHGSDGVIDVGNTQLNADVLAKNAAVIAAWGQAFNPNGDILIYGCDVAETAVGQALVAKLGQLTKTDVAASEDLTGSATKGGNWVLEYQTGAIDTATALDAATAMNWSNVLVANTAPALTASGSTPSFTEGGAAATIDSGMTVTDAELSPTNFAGASLTITNHLGANGQDVFANSGTLSALTQGSTFDVGGTTIGTVTTNSGGTLVLTFNTNATNALVDQAIQAITYANSSQNPPASVQLDLTFNDGNTGAQGTGGALTSTVSKTVSITAVNNAPTITNGATVSLTGTNENTISGTTTVASLLSGAGYADIDNATKGIAVTATVGNANWQYSTDSGTTWTNFGTVSTTSALLLDSSALVRYSPDLQNGETATFNFQAWDHSTGTASTNAVPQHADASVNGGSTAYSSGIATTSIVVTSVNDAPTITNGTTVTLAAGNEDVPSAGVTVASILTGAGYADADASASSGIAITSVVGNSNWQYSTDGGTTWTNFGAVSGTNALLLDSTAMVRYSPDLQNGETATFDFRAWDETTGTASTNATPHHGNTTTNGGTSAYSTGVATSSIVIASVNDAPTITNGTTITLTGTNENTTSSSTTVSSLLTAASLADVDTGASSGIAITSTVGNGTWQYSVNGGTTWINFGAVSSTNALLLASTAQVRYVPDGNNGEVATFSFEAWDQATGTASTATPSYADASVTGGTNAYSTGSATASITVTSVNDAPTVTNGTTVTLTAGNEDTPTTGVTVASILTGAGYADVDSGAASGIAITSAVGVSNWQYSTDGGSTWTNFGAVSGTNALLLDSTALVRYSPDLKNGETVTFGFRAWDETTGTASTNATPSYVNPGAGGGTTAYSSGSATASLVIAAVNDAPTINSGPTVTLPVSLANTPTAGTSVATILANAGVNYLDVDTGALKGMAITSVTGGGDWQYSTDGITWTSFGAVSTTNALLLTSGTLVRYSPASLSETATFSFQAWDQSTGTAAVNGTPGYGDASVNGTTTAYSLNNGNVSIRVNDAPTITNGATVTLTGITEDLPSAGATVASILTGASNADVDTNATSGIAITSTVGNGNWQYSTDGGSTWTNVGAVSATNALLFDSSALVRYSPDLQNGETATFSFQAWDETTGIASTNAVPRHANASVNGGTTAFSTGGATTSIVVSALNDAPTITNGATVTLPTSLANTPTTGTTVSSILGSAGYGDVDIGAVSGIAITGTVGNGTWQYSTDGVTWQSFGAVSSTNALLLAAGTQVRYIPVTQTETATFNFRAWDTTTGTASANGAPAYGDASINGTTTAYSTGIAKTAVLVNDAPTITNGATVTFTGISEDAPSAGSTVNSILAAAGVNLGDIDTNHVNGIAVTSATGNNTWQYSTDGGTTWTNFGAVSATNALLLDGTALVRYSPDLKNGETATFGFQAWDESTGTVSTNASPQYANASVNGGATAYSTGSASVSITVTSVNDAPTINNGGTVTLPVSLANTPTVGTTVSSILANAGVNYADVDTSALNGIAITGVTGSGIWQYSTDGITWTSFGAVSTTNALLLTSGTQIRYSPTTLSETATFSFQAWDQTTGTAAVNGTPGYADASVNGTTTAYSINTSNGSIRVNDAPTITNGATVPLTSINENNVTAVGTSVSSILTGAGYADVDAGASKGIAITSTVGNSTWQYSTDGGTTWTNFGAVSATNALLLDGTALVRYSPDLKNGETATFGFQAWDETTGTASTNATPQYADASIKGGATAYSANSATTSIIVTSVNDAPTITNGATVTLTTINEDTNSTGVTVTSILTTAGVNYADVDTGAVKGIAITSTVGNGNWQYSTDGGTTWSNFGAVSATNALLLDGTALVRYSPDLKNGETATFGFQAWDETTGTASTNATPQHADASVNGTTTAFSINNASVSITVSSVNDAPTITNTATVTLTTINEDAPSTGVTVASLLGTAGVNYADVDTGAVSGIAITGVVGNGNWQYSTDGGTTWTNFGTVSTTSALLLDSTALVRYSPDLKNGETATFNFRAWDETSGTASTNATPQHGNTTSNGGTTAYSSGAATTSIVVTSVNDAPTITNGATVTLTTTNEDTTSSGTTVSAILAAAGVNYADVDTGALSGIAITGMVGNGTWQYSTDGVTWQSFGAVSATNALLLASGTQVRYIPDGLNGETATFSFQAWDQTTGTASVNGVASYGNTSVNGTTTAYSANSATTRIIVSSVNDAPTITNTATVTLTTINEDAPSTGVTVASLLGTAGVNYADVDTGAVSGIAITGVVGNGNWQYSTDGGTTWTNFGTVSTTSALLLDSTALVRYSPDLKNGETATFNFRAWDETSGTASTNATPQHGNTTSNGGTTAYSSGAATTSIVVTSVNDAPTITNGATVTLTTTNEDTTSSGTTVSAILAAAGVNYADVDTGALSGIAITGMVGNGTWQYSTDGVTWQSFGAVSATNALLLASGTQVRYIPDGLNGETATFSFQAWDQTTGTASVNGVASYGNTSVNGTTTAYSANSATTRIIVTSVNDAPTITNGATVTLTTTNEDTPSTSTTVSTILTGASGADVDTGALSGIAVTSTVGNGTWQYSVNGGTTWVNFGAVSSTNALLLTSTTEIRYVPDNNNGETATFGFQAWDQTTGTASGATASYADASVTGTTHAYSTSSATATITVTSVNDAPTITNGTTVTLTTTNEDTTSSATTVATILASTGVNYADVDTGALSNTGIAITGVVGNGTWQYSTDGGTTWTNFGAVSATNALLLDSTAQIQYIPDGKNGETATFSFRGWDETTGSAGTYANASVNGTTTAYSANSATTRIIVTSVNDAPTITNGATVTLTTTNEDTPSTSTTVSTILTGASGADVDTGALSGIAVTSTVGNGTWQYSVNGGTTWVNFGAVSSTNALLLTSTTEIRYVPDNNNGETATFGFQAWDQTTGTASGATASYADASVTGTTHAYSTSSATATITVTSVNDAPTITNGTTVTLTTTNEDTTSSATTVATILASTGVNYADVDTGALSNTGIAITGVVGNGTWQYSTDGGTTWTNFGAVSATNALLLDSTAQIQYIPDGKNGETATFSFRGWDETTGLGWDVCECERERHHHGLLCQQCHDPHHRYLGERRADHHQRRYGDVDDHQRRYQFHGCDGHQHSDYGRSQLCRCGHRCGQGHSHHLYRR